jgi:ABC-type Mn2+/Zn2+ transport system ATPase subunit
LVKAGLEVDVWDGVEPEPTEGCVVEGVKYASERRYDAFVGLEKFWDLEAYRLGAGQLKMLEVARALAASAKLVVLDRRSAVQTPSTPTTYSRSSESSRARST